MNITYSARSHIGKVRENNEDNLYVDGIMLPPNMSERTFSIDGIANAPAIFAVCDGMGGEDDGEIASLLAVQLLAKTDVGIKSVTPKKLVDIVQSYVHDVNDEIGNQSTSSEKRVGTTLALVVVLKKGTYCFNVGDSRIYGFSDNDLTQVTTDHTADGNKLTRCIGIGEARNVENYRPIKNKSRILICSDGLTDIVSAEDIKNAMRTHTHPTEAANKLLDMALTNGGKDNVTLIVMDVRKPKFTLLRAVKKLVESFAWRNKK